MDNDVDDIELLSFDNKQEKENYDQSIGKIDKESNYLFLLLNGFFATSTIGISIYFISLFTLPYKNFIIFGIIFIFNVLFTYYYTIL